MMKKTLVKLALLAAALSLSGCAKGVTSSLAASSLLPDSSIASTSESTSSVSSESVASSSSASSASTSPASSSSFSSSSTSSASNSFTGSSLSSASSPSSVVASYYAKVDLTTTGSTLRTSLMNLLNNAAYSIPDYTTLNTTLTQCDLDPKGSGKLLGFYNEAKLNPVWDKGLTWNKEHVWPQSRGVAKTGPGADPHMLRATSTSINSSRGNDFYGLSSDGVTGGEVWDPGQYLPKYRGIAARIVFYTATRYWKKNGLELSNSPDDATSKKTMGKLSRLLEWNLTYPVDETETYRNEVLYKLYNVRNPFIDYPSLATSIWGS